jgi:hypothetical protein
VVVFEPARNLMVDVFPCEDGHAQERSLLPAIVQTVQTGEVWIGDRHFCVTEFLFGIAQRSACFIIREHGQLRFRPLEAQHGERRTETGVVSEQAVELTDARGQTLRLRRVRVQLDKPTRDGDKTIYILTNLPAEAVDAARFRHFSGLRVGLEPPVGDEVRAALAELGHEVLEIGGGSTGGAQAVMRLERGWAAASEPRKDGQVATF